MVGNQITLTQLEAFVSVVDEGSFTGAASALHTTQSNISNRVSKLENGLGVTLLCRGKTASAPVSQKRAQLTVSGKKLLKRARVILLARDVLLAEANTEKKLSSPPKITQF